MVLIVVAASLLGTAYGGTRAPAHHAGTRTLKFVYSGAGFVQVRQHIDNIPGHEGSAYDDTYSKRVKWSIDWEVTIEDERVLVSKPTGTVSGTATADKNSGYGLGSCNGGVKLLEANGKPYIPINFVILGRSQQYLTVRLDGNTPYGSFPPQWASSPSCPAAENITGYVTSPNNGAGAAWSKSWGGPEFKIALFNNYKITPVSIGNTYPFPVQLPIKKIVFDWHARLTIAGFTKETRTTPEEIRNYASQQWKALVPIYRRIFFLEAADDAIRESLAASSRGSAPPDIRKYTGPAFFTRSFFPVITEEDQIIAKTLALLENAYNDPPLADYARVARVAKHSLSLQLPSCAGAPLGARSFCERFRNGALAWTAALGQMESLAQALATTVGRESGAAKAHDAKALLLQQQAGLALLPKLRAAASSEEAAAKRFAAAMRSGHFDPRLTADQARHGIALLLHDLAARGISAHDVDAILGGTALQPRPLDLVALLDGNLSAPSPPATGPAPATITSVTFAGNQQSPSFVVHGQNLGKKPAPNPPGSPSNQPPLCPVTIQGNAGLDYGTSLFINDESRSLAAGRYRPSVNELDCVGLIVTKFTPTEVAYRFGSYYAQVYPKYVLTPGDTVQVVVNGATKTVHVKYGATVTS